MLWGGSSLCCWSWDLLQIRDCSQGARTFTKINTTKREKPSDAKIGWRRQEKLWHKLCFASLNRQLFYSLLCTGFLVFGQTYEGCTKVGRSSQITRIRFWKWKGDLLGMKLHKHKGNVRNFMDVFKTKNRTKKSTKIQSSKQGFDGTLRQSHCRTVIPHRHSSHLLSGPGTQVMVESPCPCPQSKHRLRPHIWPTFLGDRTLHAWRSLLASSGALFWLLPSVPPYFWRRDLWVLPWEQETQQSHRGPCLDCKRDGPTFQGCSPQQRPGKLLRCAAWHYLGGEGSLCTPVQSSSISLVSWA